jgi:hypothetical protein
VFPQRFGREDVDVVDPSVPAASALVAQQHTGDGSGRGAHDDGIGERRGVSVPWRERGLFVARDLDLDLQSPAQLSPAVKWNPTSVNS